MKRRYFIITVDTEGDNVWSYKPQNRELLIPKTQNVRYLPRFQQICEQYGYEPTYLVDYEMAMDSVFVDFGRDIIRRKKGEIGMHMHAFSTPPFYRLPNLRGRSLAYAGEYPYRILCQKTEYMTKLLQDTFQVQITSHRGGRWYLDNKILKMLDHMGYMVDCTVTPGLDWTQTKGQTDTSHGRDYRHFKSKLYPIKETHLWELPVTILNKMQLCFLDNNQKWIQPNITGKKVWMRPNGKNLKEMIWLIDHVWKSRTDYIEFMIHSSELMPGENPTFRTGEEIRQLYEHLNMIFAYLRKKGFTGITCSNYIKLKCGETGKWR